MNNIIAEMAVNNGYIITDGTYLTVDSEEEKIYVIMRCGDQNSDIYIVAAVLYEYNNNTIVNISKKLDYAWNSIGFNKSDLYYAIKIANDIISGDIN